MDTRVDYGPMKYELRGDNQGSLALAVNPDYQQPNTSTSGTISFAML